MTASEFKQRMLAFLENYEDDDGSSEFNLGQHLGYLLFAFDGTLDGVDMAIQIEDQNSFSQELGEIVNIYTGE